MRTLLTQFLLVLLFAISACTSSRSKKSSLIGFVPLLQYSMRSAVLKTDTAYQVFQDEPSFRASFSALSTAKKPNFDGQMVVAILMKQVPSQAFRFVRAEFSGRTVNVYAQDCQRDADSSCEKNTVVLAAIPKVGTVRRVHFFVNDQPKEIIAW